MNDNNIISRIKSLCFLRYGYVFKNFIHWKSIPCSCKPCACMNVMNDTSYFFGEKDNENVGGIYCTEHGLLGFFSE